MTDEPGEIIEGEMSTDGLYVAAREHINSCKQCTEVSTRQSPRGFGQKSSMCDKYWELMEAASRGKLL